MKIFYKKGFTLVELMITVSILSLGLVMVNGALIRIADLLGRYTNSLVGYQWMDQKMWEAKESLFYSEAIRTDAGGTGVVSLLNQKEAYWSLQDKAVLMTKGVHDLSFTVGWQQGQSFVQISKAGYASSAE